MHALWPLLGLFRPPKNSVIRERLKVKNMFKELKEYQQNWRNYLKVWQASLFQSGHFVVGQEKDGAQNGQDNGGDTGRP